MLNNSSTISNKRFIFSLKKKPLNAAYLVADRRFSALKTGYDAFDSFGGESASWETGTDEQICEETGLKRTR